MVPPSRSFQPSCPDHTDGDETILIVEDEEQVRGIMRTILRRHGYYVLDTQNVGEAFRVCKKYAAKIDLLITDVVMPGMSGRELAERVAPIRPAMRSSTCPAMRRSWSVRHGVLDPRISFQKPIPGGARTQGSRVLDATSTDRDWPIKDYKSREDEHVRSEIRGSRTPWRPTTICA